MKLGIVGAGAIGGWFGARLAAAGHEVSLLCRGEHLAAIRAEGLELDDQGTVFRVRVAASDVPRDLGAQDAVFVTLKSIDVAATLETIGPMVGPGTVIVSAMNGVPWWFPEGLEGPLRGTTLASVDPGGRVSRCVDGRRVIGCVVHGSCSMPGPGRVHHTSGNRIILGEPSGGLSPRIVELRDVLAGAGFNCEASTAIRDEIWFKLLGNLNFNPISALTGATTDRIIDFPDTHALSVRMMEEALSAGERVGIRLRSGPEARIAETRRLGGIRTSMLQDLERGRPLEVEAILGAAVEIAERVGIPTPCMSAVLALARLKNALLIAPG